MLKNCFFRTMISFNVVLAAVAFWAAGSQTDMALMYVVASIVATVTASVVLSQVQGSTLKAWHTD